MSVIASHWSTTHDGVEVAHEVPDLLAEGAGVGEEQGSLPAVDHDAWELVGRGVGVDAVPSVDPVDLAQHGSVRPPAPPEEQQDGQDDGDDDTLQHAEEDNARGGDERERKRGPAHPVVATQDAAGP